MALDGAARKAHPILYGTVIFFAFIEMAITAYLVHKYNNDGYPSGTIQDRVRFLLFVSLWSLFLFGAYLAGTFLAASNFLFSIASNVALLAVSWVFWLAGAAAWTQGIGGSLECGSGAFKVPHCNQIRAVQAFAWIEWILVTFSLAFVLFLGGKAARSGTGFGGPLTSEV